MFCENVVTLVRWICKNYSTFGLFNIYYSSFFCFFFPVIDLCSFFYSIFALFIQRFSLFIYRSILVSHLLFFFFSVLFVLFFFPFYIYNCTVFALWAHYSCNNALVSWVLFSFLFFSIFFLLNIDLSWHLYCYTDTINFTIIEVLISYKSK